MINILLQKCTYDNWPATFKCTMCGKGKGEGARSGLLIESEQGSGGACAAPGLVRGPAPGLVRGPAPTGLVRNSRRSRKHRISGNEVGTISYIQYILYIIIYIPTLLQKM